MDIQHLHSEKNGRFYIIEPDNSTTVLAYKMDGPQKMVIEHTEVSERQEGRGIGKQLVEAAVKYARAHNISITPFCTYAKTVFDRTKEFHDVLA